LSHGPCSNLWFLKPSGDSKKEEATKKLHNLGYPKNLKNVTIVDNAIRPHRILASILGPEFLRFRNGANIKAIKTIIAIVGNAGLLYAAYILILSMPDLRRYIKISTM
jgi:Family of unknown function (DUF6893)